MAQSKQREMLRCSGERYNLHTRRGARARLRCMLCRDDTVTYCLMTSNSSIRQFPKFCVDVAYLMDVSECDSDWIPKSQVTLTVSVHKL